MSSEMLNDPRRRLFSPRFTREQRAVLLPLIALVVLVTWFGVRQPAFLSPLNLVVMSAQAGPLLLLSLGATFVVLMGGIDLSIGAVAGLASALSAVLLQQFGFGFGLTFVAALLTGMLAGLVNTCFSTLLRLPSFIATLASGSIFSGVMLHVLNGSALFVDNDDFSILASGQLIPHIPNVMLLSMLLWLALSFVTSHTRFGRYAVAIGAGERIAQLSGIPVRRFKMYAFVLSSTLASAGGFFLLSRLGSATPSIGQGYVLDTVAAIVVGGTSLSGGVGGPARTLSGVALITILSNGLNVSGVSPFTQEIVKGLVIVLAVLTTIDRQSLQNIIK